MPEVQRKQREGYVVFCGQIPSWWGWRIRTETNRMEKSVGTGL